MRRRALLCGLTTTVTVPVTGCLGADTFTQGDEDDELENDALLDEYRNQVEDVAFESMESSQATCSRLEGIFGREAYAAGEANTSHPPDDLPEFEQDQLEQFREQADRLSVFQHGICSLHPVPLQVVDRTGEFDRPNHFGTVARVGDGLPSIRLDKMRDDEQAFIANLGDSDSVIVVQSTYPLNMHQDVAIVGESSEYTYVELHSRSGGADADTFIRTLIRVEDAAVPERLIIGNHFSATTNWDPGESFGGDEIPGSVVLEAAHLGED